LPLIGGELDRSTDLRISLKLSQRQDTQISNKNITIASVESPISMKRSPGARRRSKFIKVGTLPQTMLKKLDLRRQPNSRMNKKLSTRLGLLESEQMLSNNMNGFSPVSRNKSDKREGNFSNEMMLKKLDSERERPKRRGFNLEDSPEAVFDNMTKLRFFRIFQNMEDQNLLLIS